MQPPAVFCLGRAHQGRNGAADRQEMTMRLLTYLELTRCTKSQLWHFYQLMLRALPSLPTGTPELTCTVSSDQF